MKRARLIYQLALHFFGLTPENKTIILEQLYVLIKHANFTYLDAYKLPVWKRLWFIFKLKEENEKESQTIKNSPQNSSNSNNNSNIFSKGF
jgi:hypothetical protein